MNTPIQDPQTTSVCPAVTAVLTDIEDLRLRVFDDLMAVNACITTVQVLNQAGNNEFDAAQINDAINFICAQTNQRISSAAELLDEIGVAIAPAKPVSL